MLLQWFTVSLLLIISSCVAQQSRCPPGKLDEFQQDVTCPNSSENPEDIFCCGDILHRYCCSTCELSIYKDNSPNRCPGDQKSAETPIASSLTVVTVCLLVVGVVAVVAMSLTGFFIYRMWHAANELRHDRNRMIAQRAYDMVYQPHMSTSLLDASSSSIVNTAHNQFSAAEIGNFYKA